LFAVPFLSACNEEDKYWLETHEKFSQFVESDLSAYTSGFTFSEKIQTNIDAGYATYAELRQIYSPVFNVSIGIISDYQNVFSLSPHNDNGAVKNQFKEFNKQIDELSQTLQELLKQAYDSVKDSKDISKLNAELAKLAKDKKIKGENLAVSDLFDINIEGCTEHDDHDKFTIVLKADTLKNFVALLHMNKDGKWELVKDAKVNGDKLEFSIDGFSPFAIVVDTTTSTNAPLTADNTTIYFVVGIVAVAALAILVVAAKNRKQKA
jgi:hypothetical protein